VRLPVLMEKEAGGFAVAADADAAAAAKKPAP
jgi:hypothetical protein